LSGKETINIQKLSWFRLEHQNFQIFVQQTHGIHCSNTTHDALTDFGQWQLGNKIKTKTETTRMKHK